HWCFKNYFQLLSFHVNKKTSPPTGWSAKKRCSCCLLSGVKTKLRVPKIQRATFLNKIVTASTIF
ncbi:hypothetical protein PN480_06825, partial [Dolichospermum circinale CS-1225]|uniref:hypothetical protein n=1 Tax=Dolichospermum circinale TaxID=109265 RepID=UPI00232ED603